MDPAHHTTYPIRWAVLGLFIGLSASNGCMWISFASIFDETKSHYGVSSFDVNFLSLCFMIVFVVCLYPSLLIFRRLGCRNGLIIAAACNAVGASLRLIAEVASGDNVTTGFRGNSTFSWVFAGQVIGSLSNALYLGAPPVVAAVWFGEGERSFATAVAVLANSFGSAVGFAIPPLIVTKGSDGTVSGFVALYALEAALCTVPLLGMLVFVPDKPPTPPSVTSSQIGMSEASTVSDINSLFRREGFLLLFVSFSGMVGTLWGSGTLLGQLFYPWGVSSVSTGWCGFGNLMAGIASSVFIGKWLDKNRAYKNPGLLLCGGSAIMFAILIGCIVFVANDSVNAKLMVVVYIVLGLTQAGAIPVLVEFAVEVTYPLDEILSGGVLMGGANVFAGVVVIAGGVLLTDTPTKGDAVWCWTVFMIICVVSTAVLWFVKPKYHRVLSEAQALSPQHAAYESIVGEKYFFGTYFLR